MYKNAKGMKKSLFILIGVLSSLTIFAQDVYYMYNNVTCKYTITSTEEAKLIEGPSTDATAVTIPSTISVGEVSYKVTAIGNDAFKDNKIINEVYISENIKYIGVSAFWGCYNLKILTLPSTLTKIENNAFANCTGLIHICCKVDNPQALTPEKLQYNGMTTLYVKEGKKDLYAADPKWGDKYGKRILEVKDDIVQLEKDRLYYVCADVSCVATLYVGKDEEDIIIPNSVKDKDEKEYIVKGIDRWAFNARGSIRKLTIPENITVIGPDAFKNCYSLGHICCKVNDPEKLDPTNFPGNEMMTLYVPSSACVTEYVKKSSWNDKFKGRIYAGEMLPIRNDNMAYICASLSKQATLYSGKNESDVEIKSFNGYTVTGIDRRAFYGYSGITSLTIPASITAFGPDAFNNCSGLTYVYSKISDPFVINTNVFSNKSKAILYIPTGTTYDGITGWEFDNKKECNNMEVFQDDNTGMTYVGWTDGESHKKAILTKGVAGDDNFEISSPVNSPKVTGYTVVSIGDNAFNGIGGFKNLTIKEGIESIGANAFKGRTKLQYVSFPSTLTTIGDNAFNGCTSLTDIVYGDNPAITSIGVSAFQGCTGLKLITLPASLTSIGDKAFGGCNNIVEIKSNIANPFTFPTTAFPDDNIILYVLPNGAKTSYTSNGWDDSKFLHVFQGDKVSKPDTSGKLTYVTTDYDNEVILLNSDPGNESVKISASNPFGTKTVVAIAKSAFLEWLYFIRKRKNW